MAKESYSSIQVMLRGSALRPCLAGGAAGRRRRFVGKDYVMKAL